MAHFNVTEAELARDLHAVLEKVRLGAEVVVNENDHPVALIKPAGPVSRMLSDLIRLADERERRRGQAITLDSNFAESVEEAVRDRKPWTPRAWD